MLSLDENKLERKSLARDESLFRQGDKVQVIYVIEQGRLRLDRPNRICQALRTPSQPTTTVVLSGPMNEALPVGIEA